MDKLENKINKVENDVDDLKIRMAVAESNIDRVEEDISTIKDDTRFLRRTITGSIITIVVGAIIWIIKNGGI